MSKIAFRVDGGNTIGLGHVMRSLVLAKELEKTNEVIFICKQGDDELKYKVGIDKIKENKFIVIAIKERNIVNQLRDIHIKECIDCLITDSYDVDEEYFDEIKDIFKYTGYIDDVNMCRLNVDFIINQNINANSFKYNTYPNKKTKLFLGPHYMLLRDEFRNCRDKEINEKVKDIMVTVGGMDKDNNTIKVLECLDEFNGNVHVAIGGAFQESLVSKLEIMASKSQNIHLYHNAQMAKIMKKCDMAISASGSTIYELAYMKVPTIGIVVAENQKKICEELNDREVIIGTDDLIYSNIDRFKLVIKKTILDYHKRSNLIEKQKMLINGKGINYVVEQVNAILSN